MAIAIPRTTTDIAAALRRELDESEYKRGELQRQVEGADLRNAKLHAENVELQRQVDEVRGLLISSADDFVSQRRTSFLAKAYHESRMLNAQLRLDIEKHKRWHLEHGQEAGRLQSEIAAARDENGKLTRLLEASEERVLQIEAERDEVIRIGEGVDAGLHAEIDRRDRRIAELESHVAELGDTIVSREVG